MRACAIARARKCAKEPCGCALCARAPMGARAPRRAHAAVRPCPAHAQEDARVALARALACLRLTRCAPTSAALALCVSRGKPSRPHPLPCHPFPRPSLPRLLLSPHPPARGAPARCPRARCRVARQKARRLRCACCATSLRARAHPPLCRFSRAFPNHPFSFPSPSRALVAARVRSRFNVPARASARARGRASARTFARALARARAPPLVDAHGTLTLRVCIASTSQDESEYTSLNKWV